MISIQDPFSLVIFGASGHLARIKIYPSLYTLARKGRLPENYQIVGYARSDISESDWKQRVETSVRDHVKDIDDTILKEFISRCTYVSGQYDQIDGFNNLREHLEQGEQSWEGNIVRLAYYSIPPSVFAIVSELLSESKIHRRDDRYSFRVIVEKPIGSDMSSFLKIKEELTSSYQPDELYLLDHYLGKDAIRNIYYLRYANPILEHLYDHTLIKSVQISLMESAGIESRAGYFESTGTFRDMFQSHMVLMAGLLTMDLKADESQFTPTLSRALQQLYLPPASSLDDLIVQGQYDTGETGKAYRQEDNVDPNSRTNTYACMQLKTKAAKWEGVPFYLRSGKRVGAKRKTHISIEFHQEYCSVDGCKPNVLDIILHGEAGMKIELLTRLSGTENQYRPLVLTDPLESLGDYLPDHAVLLYEAIAGKQTWFLNFQDVATAWNLVDPLQAHLDNPETPLYNYQVGTTGPVEAARWLEKYGDEWRD